MSNMSLVTICMYTISGSLLKRMSKYSKDCFLSAKFKTCDIKNRKTNINGGNQNIITLQTCKIQRHLGCGLSINYFTGEIPHKFVSLGCFKYLDMSSNKLTAETKKRAKDLKILAVKMLLQLGIAENILIGIFVHLKASMTGMSFLTVPTHSTPKDSPHQIKDHDNHHINQSCYLFEL